MISDPVPGVLRGLLALAGFSAIAVLLPPMLPAQEPIGDGEFTATVTPWVTWDSQGGGHVVERGSFRGDVVAESQPRFVLFRMCDAEGGWFGSFRITNLADGVASLEARLYPMNHKPREYTIAALDVPSGSRLTSGSITLESVTSDFVTGSVRVDYGGSPSLRLVSGEPPREYAVEATFRARVVDKLTPEAAPECYPGTN